MNSDGTDQQALSSSLALVSAHGNGSSDVGSLSVSPISNAVLLARINTGGLGYVDLSDPNRLIVLEPPIRAISAKWSPDGRSIAYTSWESIESGVQAFVMSADGIGRTQITTGNPRQTTNMISVDWSPAGDRLAVNYGYRLYFVNPDGTDFQLIYSGFVRNLAWSPDGSKIAFEGEYGPNGSPYGDLDIWIVNQDGTSPVNLTQTPGIWDSTPAWSVDGAHVFFSSFDVPPTRSDDEEQIFVVEIVTGQITQLTDVGNNSLPQQIR